MEWQEQVTFGTSGLDRAEDLRRQPEALSALRDSALCVLFWRGKPLVSDEGLAQVPLLEAPQGEEVFLGRSDGVALFARDVSAHDVQGSDPDGNGFADQTVQRMAPFQGQFYELRSIMTYLTRRDAELAAMARATLEWHRCHGFCSRCGVKTKSAKAGFARTCGACGAQHFPRTDPVVIMLITHGNSVLVGRSPGWPEGMYSLLAGFVDPGESLEAAVRRETFEEAGVRVGRVRYLASQPWPFPASLMVGMAGEALSRDIVLDPDEIEDARWLTKEQMHAALLGQFEGVMPARAGSIARFLIENWLADCTG